MIRSDLRDSRQALAPILATVRAVLKPGTGDQSVQPPGAYPPRRSAVDCRATWAKLQASATPKTVAVAWVSAQFRVLATAQFLLVSSAGCWRPNSSCLCCLSTRAGPSF